MTNPRSPPNSPLQNSFPPKTKPDQAVGKTEKKILSILERRASPTPEKILKQINLLEETMCKSVFTLMIGSLARFEDFFGEIWGINEEEKTEEQKVFAQKWARCRRCLLDDGNSRIRDIQDCLKEYFECVILLDEMIKGTKNE